MSFPLTVPIPLLMSSRYDSIRYPTASATLHHFLEDWRKRDQIAGLSLCSLSLRRRESTAELKSFLCGLSNPHHESYEMLSQSRLDRRRYEFTVRLTEAYTGMKTSGAKTPPGLIGVVKNNRSGWEIERLEGF